MIKEIKGQRWYCCPHCHKPLFPLQEGTRIEHMPFRCKACKHDIEVNVLVLNDLISRTELLQKIKEAQETLISNDDKTWERNKKYYKGLSWAYRIASDLQSKCEDKN